MQHGLLNPITHLLLILLVAPDLRIDAVQPTQPAPAKPNLLNASQPYQSPYTNVTYDSPDGAVHISKLSINASHAEAAKTGLDVDTGGPNCHHADTDGVIRFVVIDDDRTKTRLLVHYFRLVEPNSDLVAAATAARAGVNATGNASTWGDAAASLHMGNVSLQLAGVSEYSFEPGLYAHDLDGLPESSAAVLDKLLWSLTDEVPESVRHITCLFYGIRRGRSGLVREKVPSGVLIRMVYNSAMSEGFRMPGRSKIRDGPWLDPDTEISNIWLATNFLLGNFAIEPSDVEVTRTSSDIPAKPNITTNMVVDFNEVSADVILIPGYDMRVLTVCLPLVAGWSAMVGVEVIFEDIASSDGQGDNVTTYEKVVQAKSYVSLGTRESVLSFVGYNGGDDAMDANNRTVHKSYTTTCLPANLTTKYSSGTVSDVTLIGLGGGGDGCILHAEAITHYYTWLYPVAVRYNDTAVYTTSRAYHLIKYIYDAGLGNVTHSSTACPTGSFQCDAYTTTIIVIANAAKKLCRDLPRKEPELYYCIKLSMLCAVLYQRLGLQRDTVIVGLGQQNAMGWPLGMSVRFLQASLPHSSGHFGWLVRPKAAVGLRAFSAGLWTIGSVLLLQVGLKHVSFLVS